jgi:hypothetical protein
MTFTEKMKIYGELGESLTKYKDRDRLEFTKIEFVQKIRGELLLRLVKDC